MRQLQALVRRPKTVAGLVVFSAALTAPGNAGAMALEPIGSFDRPTYVTSDPRDPNRLFVVEQAGRIQLTEGGSTTTFLDIEPLVHDLNPRGDYGLFSIAFSPDYETNQRFYVAYSGVDNPDTAGEDESGDWHIDEFRANGDTAAHGSRREVLTIRYPTAEIHYGGQLQFGRDGYLYASTGDGGPQADPGGNSQNLGNLLGSILRIDPTGSSPGDYTVPSGNPFAGTAGCADGCDEIWAYGLRHPWRFSFDRLTGNLVIGDVGFQLWEEVDFATGPNPGKGDNFGWNCREGAHPGAGEASTVCADRAGTFTEPAFEYGHEDSNCSITGGYVVRDRALDDLYGRYLYADFCVGELRSLSLGLPTASDDRSEGLSVPLVTSFGEDADCRIYVASFDGPVYRLMEPAPGGAVGCEPPETSIDAGPAQGSTTDDNTPTFRFSSTEPNSTFECRIDGDRFTACTSPHMTEPLGDGARSFEVRAVNPAGKPDPTPAARTFTVDAGPPPGASPLTLELEAKKQKLKKKLKFFATVTSESTLVVNGKGIKETTRELAAGERTRIRARLKQATRKRLAKRLTKKGRAKTKVSGTATDQSGSRAEDKVNLKLRD